MQRSEHRKRAAAWIAAALTTSACGSTHPAQGPDGLQTSSSGHDNAPNEPFVRPTQPMTRDQARRFVLALVNRDRKGHGLSALSWDETATLAGQRHADDMATHGFTAHLGTDGSLPEQRYTDAGGPHMVMENAGCFADAAPRTLDPDARFSAAALEKIHQAFMNEQPPNDGHRRNILTPWHTSLGVGVSQTKGLDIPCMAQEFVDNYGDYEPLPRKSKLGANLHVSGLVHSPAQIAGVGVARADKPRPAKAADLNKTYAYAIPKPFKTYFTKGFKTPIPVEVLDNRFWIHVPLRDNQNQPGLYEVSVWAKLPGTPDLLMISLRTIAVD
jgi:uncharacterized protein YkwD